MNTTTETKLELRRTFPVTRERIFAAWSDREEMVQWFGPPACKATFAEFDFRVGGRYSLRCQQEDRERLPHFRGIPGDHAAFADRVHLAPRGR